MNLYKCTIVGLKIIYSFSHLGFIVANISSAVQILKGEADSVTEGNPITSTATDNSSAADSAEDDTSEGNKRNLSLEALFQAAHSELENISKETVTGGAQQAVKKQILSRVSSDNEKIKVSNVVAYLEVPQEMEKGTYVVQSTDGNDPTVMGQVIKVEVSHINIWVMI